MSHGREEILNTSPLLPLHFAAASGLTPFLFATASGLVPCRCRPPPHLPYWFSPGHLYYSFEYISTKVYISYIGIVIYTYICPAIASIWLRYRYSPSNHKMANVHNSGK